MRTTTYLFVAGIIAVTQGCAQEDMATTDTTTETELTENTTSGDSIPEAPMTYADGVAGATPPGATDTPSSQTVTAAKVAEETREALEATGDFIADSKDQLVDKFERELKVVNAKLDEMETQSKSLSADAGAEWDRQWETIQEKRVALRTRLDDLSASTGDAWKDLRDGTVQAWDEFETAVKDAADHLDGTAAEPTADANDPSTAS